jgi:Nucleoporin Nup120/160
MNWTRLISSCAKLDHEPSVPIDLSIAQDTGYKIVVKQGSLSFITACDDSKILYHTFQDTQFDVAQLIASLTSRLSKAYPKLQDPILR